MRRQGATARPATPSDDGARWRALVVLCAAMLMTILDQTIVNVALPSIQDDLGFSRSGLAWVVNAYMVAFGGLLLLAGRLGDLAGRRNVLVAGLVVFTAASLLCGLATGPGVLVAARFVQGVGGALTSAVILGMIVTLFPDPGERARAIGAFSFSAAAGGSIGNIAGGLITDALTWNWVFLVNVPIGVAVVLLTLRVVDADRGVGLRAGSDVAGAVLVTAGLMVGVYAIVGAADHGWASCADRGPRRGVARADRGVRGAAGDGPHASAAAAAAPLSQPHGRQRRAGAHGRRGLHVPVPDRAVHAAGARLQRLSGRAGHPAHRTRHRRHLPRPVRAPLGPHRARGRWCWAGWP